MQYYSVGPYAIIKKSQLSKEDLLFFPMHTNYNAQELQLSNVLCPWKTPFTELNPNASLVTVAHWAVLASESPASVSK